MNTSADGIENRRALVTGATGGIGRAIVDSLVKAGVKVIAHGRDTEKLDRLSDQYPGLVCEPADLRDQVAVERLANDALSHYKGIDILINNAGIGIHKDVIDLELEEFNNMMDINLRAVYILSRVIGRQMVKQKSGYIINIGSGASTTPIAGLATYCASKYGLLGFSESLALELRNYGIKVSLIMPGSTATGFGGNNPQARLKAKPGILLPEDVADTVMYLLNQPRRAWTSLVNLRPLDPNRAF